MLRTIRGRAAAIKWAYFDAAAVEGYTVTQTAGAWRVTGALVPGRVDAFKLTRRPLFFVAPFKGGAWRWEILDYTTNGSTLSATLGPVTTEGSNGLTRATARH